jgi:CRISPR-associated protein Cst2
MAFITGVLAIYAPASALNNGKGEDNKGKVKAIRSSRFEYPYVSAQSFKFWVRQTVASLSPEWEASPIYSGSSAKQQSYTEGNPLEYWDDDLFGYMRAEKGDTLTRVAPFRIGTFVSNTPLEITDDFGVMARAEGNPLLHEHEFYRTTLVGGFSIDLNAVGTFTWRERTGYRNLNTDLVKRAKEYNLEITDSDVRLPIEARQQRVNLILKALSRLQGGAKQSLHYTDVAPSMVTMCVLQGGNNPFLNLVEAKPTPSLHLGALDEALRVFASEQLSPVYIGIKQGYMDDSRIAIENRQLAVVHPREAFDQLAQDVLAHPEWFA